MNIPHLGSLGSVRLAPTWHQHDHLLGLGFKSNPNPNRPSPLRGLFPLKVSKSTMTSRTSVHSCSICSTDGASCPTSRPRFRLMHNTGSPSLIIHKECNSSFLLFATFFIFLRIERNFFLLSVLGMTCWALAFSFSAKCVIGRSFVTIEAEPPIKFQACQLNLSKRKCSNENRIASLPRAFWYGPSNISCVSRCRFIKAADTDSLALSLLTDVVSSSGGQHSTVSGPERGKERVGPLIVYQRTLPKPWFVRMFFIMGPKWCHV